MEAGILRNVITGGVGHGEDPEAWFRVRGGGDGRTVALKSMTGFWFLGMSLAAMKAVKCGCCVRCFLRK